MLKSLDRVGGLEEQKASHVENPFTQQSRASVSYQALVCLLNRWTWNHGEQCLRLASFLIMGGLGTVVNLGCVWFFSRYTSLPYTLYVVLATEISLICNFALNDRFTFRAMVDGRRRWWQRGLRFHAPAMLGFGLTLLLSDAAHYLLHQPPVVAQGAAILIVMFVNFAAHHLWTYRAVAEREQPRPADAVL